MNAATLPGVVGAALAMPDIHQGYGFPIGGVAATQRPDGVVSPGGVATTSTAGSACWSPSPPLEAARPSDPTSTSLPPSSYANCPSGVGQGGRPGLNAQARASWMRSWKTARAGRFKRGLATEADLERTEEGGCLAGADAGKVSPPRPGTGPGRRWAPSARATTSSRSMWLTAHPGRVRRPTPRAFSRPSPSLQIHCGSRGLRPPGLHRLRQPSSKKPCRQYGLTLPDRELVCAPGRQPRGPRLPGAPCRPQPTTPSPTGRCWRFSHPTQLLSRFWPAGSEKPPPLSGLRYRPQHGQDRPSHTVGGRRSTLPLRAPQRGHARLRPRLRRVLPAVYRDHRAARPRPGVHGHFQPGCSSAPLAPWTRASGLPATVRAER